MRCLIVPRFGFCFQSNKKILRLKIHKKMKMSFTYSIVMMRRCVKEKLPSLLLEVIHILLGKVLAQPRFHMKSKILRVEYSADDLNSRLWFSGENFAAKWISYHCLKLSRGSYPFFARGIFHNAFLAWKRLLQVLSIR